MKLSVAVLGASENPERYSHQACLRLKAAGYSVLPIHPELKSILEMPVYPNISSLPEGVDTLTVYVRAEISSKLKTAILQAKFRRIIFNPGSENLALQQELRAAGLSVVEACTLVLLSTGQFEML